MSKALHHAKAEDAFVQEIQALEERMFGDQLDPSDGTRIKNDGYSWRYRPSHHARTGLITQDDLLFLSMTGKRLLSVGAHPAFFERILCELGVSPANIVLADSDPEITKSEGFMEKIMFDATEPWPDIGTFDRIIFPESLCIAVGDKIKRDHARIPESKDSPFPTDPLEAELLTIILGQALQRLRPQGIIRANGPMSHPSVIQAVSAKLEDAGKHHVMEYRRYFLVLRTSEKDSSLTIH